MIFFVYIIACFYSEICTIYQIYVSHKFIAEMKIPARIRSESSSMAKVRSRQRIEVATRSLTMLSETLLRQRRSLLRQKKSFKEGFHVATPF